MGACLLTVDRDGEKFGPERSGAFPCRFAVTDNLLTDIISLNLPSMDLPSIFSPSFLIGAEPFGLLVELRE